MEEKNWKMPRNEKKKVFRNFSVIHILAAVLEIKLKKNLKKKKSNKIISFELAVMKALDDIVNPE